MPAKGGSQSQPQTGSDAVNNAMLKELKALHTKIDDIGGNVTSLRDDFANLNGTITELKGAVQATSARMDGLEHKVNEHDEVSKFILREMSKPKFRMYDVPSDTAMARPTHGEQAHAPLQKLFTDLGVMNALTIKDAVAFPQNMRSSTDQRKMTIVFEVDGAEQARLVWRTKRLLAETHNIRLQQNLPRILQQEKQQLLAHPAFKQAIDAERTQRQPAIIWDGERCYIGKGQNKQLWTLAKAKATESTPPNNAA